MEKMQQIYDLMYDMNAELDAACQGFNHIYELLFEGNVPSSEYTNNYNQLYSMYWLFMDTLNKFAGKYSLLMGEDDNPRMRAEMKSIQDLYAMNKWWQTPENQRGDNNHV